MSADDLFLRQRACFVHLVPSGVAVAIATILGGLPLENESALGGRIALVVMWILASLAFLAVLVFNSFPLSREGKWSTGPPGGSSLWTRNRALVERFVFFGRSLMTGGMEALCVLLVVVRCVAMDTAMMQSLVFALVPVFALGHTLVAWHTCAAGLDRGAESGK